MNYYLLRHYLNKFHENIKYTYEKEQNNSITFLDITLRKDGDGHLKTDSYVKPIKSDRVVNLISQHPPHQKKNLVVNEIKRMLKLVDPIYQEETIEIIKQKFQKSIFLEDYINEVIQKTMERHLQS